MPAPLDLADPSSPVSPSREDPIAAGASEVIGGPMGRHAVIGPRGTAGALVSLVLAVAALVAAGVVERAHCLSVGWSAPDHFWHACYSDIPVVYGSSPLATGGNPLLGDAAVDQPLPTSLLMWATAHLVPGGATGLAANRWYFGIWSVLATALLVLLAAALVRSQPRHPWRVAHLASPALPFLALVSFEVVPVVLAGTALAAWGRRRPVLAGVLLGLAILARPWALLVLVALGLLAVRTGRRMPWLLAAGAALGAALLTLAVALLAGADSAVAVYGGWWGSVASYGSPWFLSSLAGQRLSPALLSAIGVAGWVAAVVAGAYLALSSRRRPRVGELVLVMLVVVMLTGKSLPVQVGLWMVLLMAVVGVRWRTHLVWAGVEVAYFVAVWLHIASVSAPDRGLPAGWYAVFVVARLVAWGWVAAEVWGRASGRPAALAVAPAEPAELPDGPQHARDGAPSGEHRVVPRHEYHPGHRADESDPSAVEHPSQAQPADVEVTSSGRSRGATRGSSRAEARTGGRAAGRRAGRAVVEDDELAGPFAGAADDTVVTFV